MPDISRRRFLLAGARTTAGLLFFSPLEVWAKAPKKFNLNFYHTHTEEYLTVSHTPGRYSKAVQNEINQFLRDFRTGEMHPIDLRLLDQLCAIRKLTGSRGTINIISGYRSPETNEMLCHTQRGVARKSLHMKGQAIDIRISDISSSDIRDVAVSLEAGGVGYYACSDFVHLDTGPYRTW